MTTIISDEQARQFAAALYAARRTRVPIPPFTDEMPDLTHGGRLRVQQRLVRRSSTTATASSATSSA